MLATDPTVRLRLATRIHFALLRHCSEPVGVCTLLMGGDEAREALWVGQASGQPELVAHRPAHRPEHPPARRPAGSTRPTAAPPRGALSGNRNRNHIHHRSNQQAAARPGSG